MIEWWLQQIDEMRYYEIGLSAVVTMLMIFEILTVVRLWVGS